MQFVGDRDVIDLDDVGMAQNGDRLRLVLEAADKVGVMHQLLTQHLDGHHRAFRHRPAGSRDHGLVDVGHAACADELLNGVEPVQRLADEIIHASPPAAPRPAAAR